MSDNPFARSVVAATRRGGIWLAAGFLALLAYVPALTSSPGRMPADTKLYLYLDPDRLITDAPWTFDGRQFAGWVPHQVIAYLWPQGPWFSLGAAAGVPDWVVHRLWIGTLLFAAGAGVLWAARRFGLGVLAALAAAAVYQLAPYVLPYVSRTSAMLLPWAGLGWIVGLTALAATVSRWRHAALCALVVATVGAVNATALAMVALAPILWLLVAALERRVGWGRAVLTALRIGALSLAVSVWWIAAVIIQGRRGAPVLAYSESLESVSFTSTSPEVWRGLGYWLTYVRDPYAPTTTAGGDYLLSGRLIVGGFLLVIAALLGLVLTRWHERRFAITLVVTGVVLGVGVHPFGDPSPLMDLLAGDGESGLALALRSSTRAVPMLMLGLALGAGALVDALRSVRFGRLSPRPLAAAAIVVLAIVNLPALTGHRLVDPAIDREEDPPQAWLDAAAYLDSMESNGRVLQVPGSEFGAFRWGYTVDPPLPGLIDRPVVTRDLLPLGSAPAMDLLYALDDRFQAGVVESASIAPVARLLGVDTVWLTGDQAFDRFRTARPEVARDALAVVHGLVLAAPFGLPTPNVPTVTMIDEQSLSDPRVGQPIPPVELFSVQDAVDVVRVKDREVVVAGSGDGLVDAAAAGLIDGRELIRYSASLDGEALAQAVEDAVEVVVTDSNRARAHHWRGSQDVVGLTEDDDPSSPDVLRRDVADERLPVFGDVDVPLPSRTVAVQNGPVRARATAYGEPFAFRPEDRAVMAIDGDPTTAWVVGDRADPVGEVLQLEIDEPIDHVTLLQPDGAGDVRHVGEVTVRVEGGEAQRVVLDDRSLDGAGQRLALETPTDGPSTVTITIESVVVPDETLGPAATAVGFAEVDVGLAPTVEVVRVPSDVTDALRTSPTTPLSYVFTRLRTRPTDRWRSDPEPTMTREFDVPAAQSFTPGVEVRLDQRASDEVLGQLLGVTGSSASARLTGVARAAGWSATDGDPATAWITPFSQAVGSTLSVTLAAPATQLVLTQRVGDHSPITALRITSASGEVDVAVPPPDAAGTTLVALPGEVSGPIDLTIAAVDPVTVLDRRYAEPVALPAAISEVAGVVPTPLPARLDTGCRDDLLTIDGEAVELQVTAFVGDLLAGAAVPAVPCGRDEVRLDDGPHRLATTAGTGWQVDRVVLGEPAGPAPPGDAPTLELTSSDRLSRTATVSGCAEGCWLVLGEGWNEAWSAEVDGADLGPPQLVDGGFNGWRLPPSARPVEVTMRWTAQTPQTLALIVSAVAALVCLLLAALDRRRRTVVAPDPPRLAIADPPPSPTVRWVATAVWIVAAALFVGWGWTLLATIAAGLLVWYAGRPRLAGLVTVGLLAVIAAVVVQVVRKERPWPGAGWPVRFEWLHGLGLFAAVSLLVALFSPSRRPDP